MAARIHELRAKLGTLVTEANEAFEAVQAAAEAEGREITAEERKAQDAFDKRIEVAKAAYDDEARKVERLALVGASVGTGDPVPGSGPQVVPGENRAEGDPRKGFRSHVEFFTSVIENAGLRNRADVSDERLRPLAVSDGEDKQARGVLAYLLPAGFAPKATAGSDEQGGYSDTYGGFSVPTTRAPGLLQVGFEGDPTAGRTQDVPMASPSVEILARTDKDHTTSVSGGFTVTRKPETVAATSSRMALELITLKASSLFGLAYATEEILADSAISFAALIDAGFRTQMGAHILNEKIRGGGGNEYLGVLNSPAKVEVSKETNQAADTIVANNVIKMAARSWGFGNAIWLANHDTRPQLATLSIPIGTGGVLLYQPAQQERFPDMLWGRPVFYTEYASKVGDAGDIMLVDWSQYLEGTYQPIQSAESVHVRFIEHERTFKLWTRNAGAPWWRTALTPNKSGDTLSPIVTLAARA
jgi:HK97 family phage major capsid protein